MVLKIRKEKEKFCPPDAFSSIVRVLDANNIDNADDGSISIYEGYPTTTQMYLRKGYPKWINNIKKGDTLAISLVKPKSKHFMEFFMSYTNPIYRVLLTVGYGEQGVEEFKKCCFPNQVLQLDKIWKKYKDMVNLWNYRDYLCPSSPDGDPDNVSFLYFVSGNMDKSFEHNQPVYMFPL